MELQLADRTSVREACYIAVGREDSTVVATRVLAPLHAYATLQLTSYWVSCRKKHAVGQLASYFNDLIVLTQYFYEARSDC